MGRGSLLAKIDIKAAYRSLPVTANGWGSAGKIKSM